MRVLASFLISLVLHASLLLGLGWLEAAQRAKKLRQNLEIRLPPLPPHIAKQLAEAAKKLAEKEKAAKTRPLQERPSALPKTAQLPAQKPPPPPKQLRGSALRRAQKAVAEHLFYPPEAIRQGLEGEVVLLLTLDDGGAIERSEIARSSGHTILDQAALKAVRSMGTLPGNPKQTLLPVRFQLE